MTLSCHMYVLAGQTLSQDEMSVLIRQLGRSELSDTCQHGRPTMV